MVGNRVARSLYRSLYRLSSKFEAQPSFRVAVYRMNSVGLGAEGDTAQQYYSAVLQKFFGKRHFFIPPYEHSLKEILQREFRATDKAADAATQLDVGFMFLRKLSSISSGFVSAQAQDRGEEPSESPPSKPVASVNIPPFELQKELSSGVLLAAHPMLSGSLHRAVVLLLEHSDKGSYGLVINRPTEHTLNSAVKNLPAEFVNRFGKSKVHFGGMVRRMQFLHSVPTCGGISVPFCSDKSAGLFAGGSLSKALSHIKQNPQESSKFTFFVGCCCWGPDQLQHEIESGYWIAGRSQPDALIRMISSHDAAKTRKYRGGRLVHTDDLHELLLKSLGDEFQGLMDIPHWLDSSMLESCDR